MFEIENGETAKTEPNTRLRVVSVSVGASMQNRPKHLLEHPLFNRFRAISFVNSDKSAHDQGRRV